MSNVIAFSPRPQVKVPAHQPQVSEAYATLLGDAVASLSELIDDLGEKIASSTDEKEVESLMRIRGTVYIALLTADAERMGQFDFTA